jgi:hypothetical protein
MTRLQPVPAAVQRMPVFVGHGDLDPLVPVQLARQTAQGLQTAGEAAGNLPAPALSCELAPHRLALPAAPRLHTGCTQL